MPETIQPAKRLSLSQVVEMLLTRGGAGDRSSVTLTQNATGATQIEVKVRTGDDDDVATVDAATEKAVALYDLLRERYPHNAVHDDADITLTRNAKGETQISVGVKTSSRGFATLADAAAHALEVYDRTRGQYPMASGYSAKPGSVAP
jgi:hypothetical protein